MQLPRGNQLSRTPELGVRRAFRFLHDRNFLDSVSHFFAQTAAPNVTGQKDLRRRRERHGENRPEQSSDEQAPDKNGNDHRHRMQAHGVADNARRNENRLEILHEQGRRP